MKEATQTWIRITCRVDKNMCVCLSVRINATISFIIKAGHQILHKDPLIQKFFVQREPPSQLSNVRLLRKVYLLQYIIL